MQPGKPFIASTVVLALLVGSILLALSTEARAAPPLGVNYENGNGMDQLNCDGGNTAQIAADMAHLKSIGVKWIRIEASTTAESGLLKSPACPKLAPFQGLRNMLKGIESAQAKPVIILLVDHYDSAARAPYLAWLEQVLAEAPESAVFEVGDEENLSQSTEGYKGAPPGGYPYGWRFNAADFGASDRVGMCPKDSTKAADLDGAVASYVAWLADSYAAIKAKRPHATVMIGGLSSWQAQCWTEKLGQHGAYRHADAIAYHAYGATPNEAVAALDAFQPIVKSWPKHLDIWITEFGFTTGSGASRVATEQLKASELAETYRLLARRVSSPILYYTAREWPLTTAQWKQQCGYGPCVLDKPGSNPGHIPGTERDASGSGLFEQLDGHLIEEPAEKAFGAATRAP
ncbi:glycosyl hydrolase [Bradyrhizobium sp.]|uniref:glycosyl hydrolase n=1 Tax=Bradyrhizobium sp. TaxID=376 RepID=UPI001EBA1184|nr:glycosyl hydrolase [Bradyrhizobium sp.]MBV8916741.1 hypothetical protein [Bradyrhizobium sp.]MBV9981557.1 hypothetical protein [Bradyrhizobium sp.]